MMKNAKISPVAVVGRSVVLALPGGLVHTFFATVARRGRKSDGRAAGRKPILRYLIALVSDVVLFYVVAWAIARTGEQTVDQEARLSVNLQLAKLTDSEDRSAWGQSAE
jgi:hypothetical protein